MDPNEAIPVVIGIALLRVLATSAATPMAMDEEALVRSSICASRSCVVLPTEGVLHAAAIARPATVVRATFRTTVARGQAMADRVGLLATEAEVDALRAVVEATSAVEVAEDTRAAAVVAIPAVAAEDTPVEEAIAATTRSKLQ